MGLRCLRANLGPLRESAQILEFDLRADPDAVAAAILAPAPRIVGLGVHLWNVAPITQVARRIKQQRPDVRLVLGGPEISHDPEQQRIFQDADLVLAGEADLAFRSHVEQALAGGAWPQRLVHVPPPDLAQVALPYNEYSDTDLAHRIVYIETTRGCPFRCEYCLSALDHRLRRFPLEPVLAAWDGLMARGARTFKFVDRTCNADVPRFVRILEFLRPRWRPELHVHFEITPDFLPNPLRQAIRAFPRGALHFEAGLQTWDPAVAARVQRRCRYETVADNLRFLIAESGHHVHADLIAGLPGETLAGFAAGFDRLFRLQPQQIQVGILKKLRGTAIARHDQEWGMQYNSAPPYEILESATIPRAAMDRLKRLARYWEMLANRALFPRALPLVWAGAPSPFFAFLEFSDWLHARLETTFAIPLEVLVEALLEFLVTRRGVPRTTAALAILEDYRAEGKRQVAPRFLRRAAGTV